MFDFRRVLVYQFRSLQDASSSSSIVLIVAISTLLTDYSNNDPPFTIALFITPLYSLTTLCHSGSVGY